MSAKQKRILVRIIISALFVAVLSFVNTGGVLGFALWMIPYFIIGYDILWKACCGIINGQLLDENFLMSVATLGAIALAVWGRGDYTEAVAVMLFYQIGELFQSYALGKSRKSISALMDIRPDHANIERDGRLVSVSPEEVSVGQIIVVNPGERVAIDGIVEEGESDLDTSALTGESVPRTVSRGDEVLSASVNISRQLRIRTVRPYGESAVARILELVENASANKSRSEKFITRFARIYTPAVCIAALLLAILPPMILGIIGAEAQTGEWIYRALSFLVISCPCALVISIPMGFFASLGGASRKGILVKGSSYLEALSKVRSIALDKTGTVTKGSFEVREVRAEGISNGQLIEYAALAESASSHPIARGLIRAYGKEPDISRVSEVREIGGCGVEATVDGIRVCVGNRRLVGDRATGEKGAVYVTLDRAYAGYIVISDMPKAEASEAVRALERAGVGHIVMLTGDSESVARDIAKSVGIGEVRSELLPDGKVAELERIMSQHSGKVAFVGDGINDAPVLARADVGIAMGAIGSDAATAAADVVIMDDDVRKVAEAIRISRKCMRIAKQNIIFSIGVKLLCLILVAVGLAGMELAIFADVGVLVLAVLNSMRGLY
ncbi:MAG: cadmium-translocating P-type ATPase [Clostridia bacterium]|nr:cadmium-translocating P-type ATPase [Clostridia bacterium]